MCDEMSNLVTDVVPFNDDKSIVKVVQAFCDELIWSCIWRCGRHNTSFDGRLDGAVNGVCSSYDATNWSPIALVYRHKWWCLPRRTLTWLMMCRVMWQLRRCCSLVHVEQLGSAMWLVIIGSLIVTGSTLKSSIKVASFWSQIIVLTSIILVTELQLNK